VTHPLDHDGDGRKGGSLSRAKRGRPAKSPETVDKHKGALRVIKADAIFDGKGGFLPVGAMFDAVDEEAANTLKARGLAE
jgi:hypothetical protein